MRSRAILILALLFTPALAWAQAGRVLSKSGETSWRPAATAAAWSHLERGDQIPVGATVRTGDDGAVRLLMKDRSILALGPESEMSLASYDTHRGRRKVNIKIAVGLLWARVTTLFGGGGSYDIESKTAVAGVRGTDLVVLAKKRGETAVTCIGGSIRVRSLTGEEVIIGHHQRASVGLNGAIETERLTAAQMRRLTQRIRSGQLDPSKRGQRMLGAGHSLDRFPAPDADTPRPGGKGVDHQIDQIVPSGRDVPPIDLEPSPEAGRLRGRIEVRDP